MRIVPFLALVFVATSDVVVAQTASSEMIVFRGVRIFDGRTEVLSAATDVVVRGNAIVSIGPAAPTAGGRVIDGKGRTLIPGLIDVHVHMTFSSLTMEQLLAPGLSPERAEAEAAKRAAEMLLRGFTSVRDMGGPVWGLKAGIDSGKYLGPRIWPSGPAISQTAGHGDFRLPHERSRRLFGEPSRAEKLGATFIVDGRDDVLTAVRENLRFGASQIKLMAGGGTSSDYDPLDVTQYTLDEMKAAVEAANDWGTYVTVHAYHPRSVRRAIAAGVRCIEHGQLLDEATLRLMATRGVWLSLQNLMVDSPAMSPTRREKRRPVVDGQDRVWPLAKRLGVKLAWGTDFLFEPDLTHEQNAYILRLRRWFTPAQILKLVTHDNARLLALSGPRAPYQGGTLGVIEEGALADLILVEGNPLADVGLLADPDRAFVIIMKDGKFVKDRTAELRDDRQ